MGPLVNLIPIIGSILERVVPDKTARERAQAEIAKAVQDLEADIVRGQIDINREEARHSSVFVSGWRPFIGWVCGFGFAYSFLAMPFLSWAARVNGLPEFPELDGASLMTLTLGMLGLAGVRSYEKTKGVSR